MNLYHLNTFLAVARSRSFTRAADDLHLTQPTVSSGVNELEKSLGVKLFNRSGRSISLTMEGRMLVSYAEQIHDLTTEAQDRMHQREVEPGESFRFGAIDAAVIYLLPPVLEAYHSSFPQVNMSVQVDASRFLVDDLMAGRSEFGILTLPLDHPKIDTLPLHKEALTLVVGSGHALARRKRVKLDEVARETLILFHEGSVSRKPLDEHLAEAGLSPGRVMEMSSPEAMRKLVESGVGVSFLPWMTVQDSVAVGALTELSVVGVSMSRQIGLAWRRGRYFSPVIQAFLDLVVDAFDQSEAWSSKQNGEDQGFRATASQSQG
jgi:DNA-binding transcriptional LysR family regulator